VVEAPSAAEAAGGLDHCPEDNGCHKNLPWRGAGRVSEGKARQAQTRGQRAKGEKNAAGKRPLAQPE